MNTWREIIKRIVHVVSVISLTLGTLAYSTPPAAVAAPAAASDSGDTATLFSPWESAANDTPPNLSGLPNQLFGAGSSLPGTIDLWAYASDAESAPSELTYTIEGAPHPGAGVTLEDNRYVHVSPSPNWCGGADVTVRATDPGDLWDNDTFRVAVAWACPGPVEMPRAPVLIAPVDGSTVRSATPAFAWSAVQGAEEYQIQVDDDVDFSGPEVDETTSGTVYSPLAELRDGTYTWRVRALAGGEEGNWSESWAFSLLAPSPVELKLYLPLVVRAYP